MRPPITRQEGPLLIKQIERALDYLEENAGGGSPDWADVTGKPSTFPPETHSHAISDVTGLQTALDSKAGPHRAGFVMMAPAATVFIANSADATALGTQVQVANRTVIAPFVTSYNVTIDQVGVSVSTLLAANDAKVVVYTSDANGRPSTVALESGNISTAATGAVFTSVSSFTFTAGLRYWIGVRASGTFTLRTLGVSALPVLSYTSAATPVGQSALIVTETFANAAATWSYASSQHSNALVPLVLMRVA